MDQQPETKGFIAGVNDFDFDEANHSIRVGWVWVPIKSRKCWKILELLKSNYEQPVPNELIDDIVLKYARDEFDGPDDLEGVRRGAICRLREMMEGSNYAIVTHHGYGYGLYRAATAPRKSGQRLARYA